LGGRGDDDYDDDVRWEEQDMPYLSHDRRRAEAEGGEGDVDDGVDEHVDGRVRGPHRADTGNGRRRRLRRDGDNDDDVEECGSHPTTPQTTATRELVERLHSVGIPYASEVSLSDVDNVNGRRRRLAMDHPMMMKREAMLANYGRMPPFFLQLN